MYFIEIAQYSEISQHLRMYYYILYDSIIFARRMYIRIKRSKRVRILGETIREKDFWIIVLLRTGSFLVLPWRRDLTWEY